MNPTEAIATDLHAKSAAVYMYLDETGGLTDECRDAVDDGWQQSVLVRRRHFLPVFPDARLHLVPESCRQRYAGAFRVVLPYQLPL